MRISKHIHALKIPFQIQIAPGAVLDRSTYVYIIFGKEVVVIDSGVRGTYSLILDYLKQNAVTAGQVSALILTHSHPDHIGGAKRFKEITGCVVCAHPGEQEWIEHTDIQARERPVPGFCHLVEGSVAVDNLLADQEIVEIGEEVTCTVIHTPGHSAGSISLHCEQDKAIITGDAVLPPLDLPVYENIWSSMTSIRKLMDLHSVDILLSSLSEPVIGRDAVENCFADSSTYLKTLHQAAIEAKMQGYGDPLEVCRRVVHSLNLPPSAINPIVANALASSFAEIHEAQY